MRAPANTDGGWDRALTASSDPLARALVAGLEHDTAARVRLRELLESPTSGQAEPPAYTPESLAVTVGLSAKTIRNAITRGELRAVKRGGRWLISRDAVDAWAGADRTPATAPRRVRDRRGTEVMSTAMARLPRRTLEAP